MTMDARQVAEKSALILDEVEKAVVGKRAVLERILAAFLSNGGHVLLEDFPGLAKTLIANSLATVLGLNFKRIQFTPDLLPGDITGGYFFDRNNNQFVLRKGPLFSNLVLADEINRASPKTQSALLEAMQEYQITLETDTMSLPQPFLVIATQNPIEYEGTFPLPEAQLDRFIMKLSIGYPTEKDEQAILHRRHERQQDAINLQTLSSAEELLEMRRMIETVHIDEDLEKYIVTIVSRTRSHRLVHIGASPRGGLALLKLSRARAAMQGRAYVIPDDIKLFAGPALGHRLILEPDMWSLKNAADGIIDEIVHSVAVPSLP